MSSTPAHRRARSAVIWALAAFAALQGILFGAMSTTRGQILRDPDWGIRLRRLERRLAERPESPLVLILGSSRVGLGLRPDKMMDAWRPQSPIVFNFSRRGFGPMVSLLYLRRILDEGIRPDWVLFEIWPAFLSSDNIFGRDDETLDVRRLQWRDRDLVTRDAKNGDELIRLWLQVQPFPWYWHRSVLIGYFAPKWGPPVPFGDDFWAATDDWGWRDLPNLGHERFERFVERAEDIKPVLERLDVSAGGARRVADLLKICNERQIPVSLLYMPESSALRGWYSDAARGRIDRYLHGLRSEFGAPLIDARDWMPDRYFSDTHHLTTEGAVLFSRQLAELIGPPSKGEPLVARSAPDPDAMSGARVGG